MAAEITNDALEAFLHCKFKAHLKLTGQHGIRSDYEAMLLDMRADVRLTAIESILARCKPDEVERAIPLTTAALKRGAAFILHATLDDLHFDGLKRVDGPSKLGDFHYVPMLFHEGNKVGKEQRLLLEIHCLIIGRLQGKAPASGIIWHGKDCKASKVRLGNDDRKIQRLLDEFKQLAVPALILNDHCSICEFRQRCQEQAIREDNISLLRGLGPKEIKGLARKGISTVTQLAHTFRPRRKRRRTPPGVIRRYHALQALAVHDNKTYVMNTPSLPYTPLRLYLDVEGLPDDDFYYLIGLRVSDGTSVTHQHFWADSKADESSIWAAFRESISRLDAFTLYHYGSYESRYLSQMGKQYGIPSGLHDTLTASSVNVLSHLYAHFYLPIVSNDLKSAATSLGFQWAVPGASGLSSIAWRRHWDTTKDDSIKHQLIGYNGDDCHALEVVTSALLALAGATPTDGGTVATAIHVDTLKRRHPFGFGRNAFCLPELEHINKCAYFDYQRERIYLRTSKAVRTSLRKQRRAKTLIVKAHKEILCTPPSHCPKCGARHIGKHVRVSKLVNELKRSKTGIKKWVIRYRSWRYLCRQCGATFIPSHYHAKARSKYGHSVLAWSVYRNIELRQSHGSITQEMMDLFGFRGADDLAFRLKAEASHYYKATYATLLAHVQNGELVHVDETKVSIKGVEGYVWAFTNLSEVVYIYSNTRHGDLLQTTLKSFSGILVSDFYAAYDSVKCIQQKCLIHLIRDINDDVFKMPFDEELKALARDFTTLLTPIIAAIDKYGLKKRHLHKYVCKARRFVDKTVAADMASPLAQHYQRRINKYRDKLFVFLEHDGVPWNNNNAEHAIKRFAFLRRVIGGSCTAKGIDEYLVLLSICETLRLRGAKVLDVLMSGTVDIDAFTGMPGKAVVGHSNGATWESSNSLS